MQCIVVFPKTSFFELKLRIFVMLTSALTIVFYILFAVHYAIFIVPYFVLYCYSALAFALLLVTLVQARGVYNRAAKIMFAAVVGMFELGIIGTIHNLS